MSIAGMVLGIVAVTLGWIPIIGIVSIPLVLVGMPLSIISLIQRRQRGMGIGMSVAGVATNSVAILFIILYLLAFTTGTTTGPTPTP